MSEGIELSRDDLYEAVWTKPIAIAAADFRMTSVRLKRLCREHDVPVPSLGHWRKSRTRRERDTVPLPPAKVGQDRVWVTRLRRLPALRAPVAVTTTAPNGRWQHECTKRTADALGKGAPDRRGKLTAIGAGIASVVVRPQNVARALAILDALLEAAEDAGLSVTTQSIPAALVVAGVQVPFSLIDNQRGLVLVLGDNVGAGQRLWADRWEERLEDRVLDIVAAARLHAKAIEARASRIDQRNAAYRAAESERMLRSKRLTLLREHADMLEEAARMERLAARLRETDSGSLPRLPAILAFTETYVKELRENCSADAFDRAAGEWGAW